ncbi:lysostaphin resistance A-like protein [Chloroflexota bacterium]
MNSLGKSLTPTKGQVLTQPVAAGINKWQQLIILTIILAVAGCEYLFVYYDVAFAIGVALFMVLGIYTIISIFRLNQAVICSAESLALLPLYILFTSSLPWFFINQQYLLPAVYSIIIALSLWHTNRNNISLKSLFGFRKEKLLRYLLLGITIGSVLGTIEYFVLRPPPAFPAFELRFLLRDFAYMLLFVSVAEELLFRGLIQKDLMATFGDKRGIILAALVFAVMHLTWRSVPELIFVFFAGLIMGVVYWRTKSLVAPLIAHGIGNTILVAVLPYIVA